MTGEVRTLGGAAVFVCAAEGPDLDGERAATDIVGAAYACDPTVVAIPVGRLSPDFLTLGTGVAGAAIQKFVNYGFRVAFVGDISGPLAASGALRDFVRESNRGRHAWFVADFDELRAKLADGA